MPDGYNSIRRIPLSTCDLQTPEGIQKALTTTLQYANSSFISYDPTINSYIDVTEIPGSGSLPMLPNKQAIVWDYPAINDFTSNNPEILAHDVMGVPQWIGFGGGLIYDAGEISIDYSTFVSPTVVYTTNGSGITVTEPTPDNWLVVQNVTTANGCGLTKTPNGGNTSIAWSTNLVAGAGITLTPSVANTSITVLTNLTATLPIVITAGAGTNLNISLDSTGYDDQDVEYVTDIQFDEDGCPTNLCTRTVHYPAILFALGLTISEEDCGE